MFTATGGGPSPPVDPLAGIPFSLRLQTHSGFGATPNATTGLYQNFFAGVMFVMPALNPLITQTFTNDLDTESSVVQYSFGLTDPSVGIYVGIATGDPATDGAALVDSITTFQGGSCSAVINGSNKITIQSLSNGGNTSVIVTFPDASVIPNNSPSVSGATPATLDGDPVAAWADVLGTSGMVFVQSNSMLQPKLRIIGGIAVVVFDGVDDVMTTATLGGDCAFFGISVGTNGTAVPGILGDSGDFGIRQSSGGGEWRGAIDTASNGGDFTDTTKLLYVNGVQTGIIAANTWHTLSCNGTSGSLNSLGDYVGSRNLPASCTAVMVGSGIFASRVTIETFITSLNP